MEDAHGRAAGVVRTLKRALEKRYHQVLKKQHPVMAWLVRHSGWSITRLQPRAATGRTPHEELKGKPYGQPMIEFGETIQFKAVEAEKDKLNTRYYKGIYVGRVDTNDENLVLTENGLFKARSIMRMTEDKRWDEEVFNKLIGTPWNPKSLHGHDDIDRSVTDLSGKSARGLYTTKKMVEELGLTDGCPACERKTYNAAHSFKCKNRFDALTRQMSAPTAKAAAKAKAKATAKPMAQNQEERRDEASGMEVDENRGPQEVEMEEDVEGADGRGAMDEDKEPGQKRERENL